MYFSSREANQDTASTLQAEVAESDFTTMGHLFDDMQWIMAPLVKRENT